LSLPAASTPDRSLDGLLRHSLTYSLVPVIGRVISFLMLPFYTAVLSEAEYGVIAIADLLLVALQQILGLNLLGGMVRLYHDQRDERDRRAVISSTILILGAATWIACLGALVFRDDLTWLVFGRGQEGVGPWALDDVLTLCLLIVPLQLTTQAGLYYLMAQHRSGTYSAVQMAKLVVELALKIGLMSGLGLGMRGFFLSVLAGEALATLGLTGWALRDVGLRIDGRVFRPVLRYALPLIPVGLCQLGLHQLDRRLLEALSPQGIALTYVGIYNLGYQLGAGVNQAVGGPFQQSWQPWIYKVGDPRERADTVARVTSYALIVIAAASLAPILFAREVVIVIVQGSENPDGFRQAWRVIPWVSAGYVLWNVYQMAQVPLFIDKATRPLLWINLAALVVNVALNFWLVPLETPWGRFMGAAFATLGTFTFLAALCMWTGHARAHVTFELGRMAATLAIVGVGLLAEQWIDGAFGDRPLERWNALAGKLGVLTLLLALLWRAILSHEERARATSWARQRVGLA
jgi:O-antigen/teichoic acid export membrane protein